MIWLTKSKQAEAEAKKVEGANKHCFINTFSFQLHCTPDPEITKFYGKSG